MQQQQPDWYAVPAATFDKLIQKIAQQPYLEVANILGEAQQSIVPQFGQMPDPATGMPPDLVGPGGRVVRGGNGRQRASGDDGVMPDPPADDAGDAGQSKQEGAK